ncbi:hypothetical protein FSP39_001231 [Pinctada imbricata]|uniref:Interleukin 17-like protein n=1 Tax=Pinctada imbricata TaxID=66713 RepID=A0AA88XV38_PINIB|nr:hypothetical protein FSP39_001231 [Pinctada imbricata]
MQNDRLSAFHFQFQLLTILLITNVVSSNPLSCREPGDLHEIFMNLTHPDPLEYLLLPDSNQNKNYIPAPVERPTFINGIKDCPNSQTNLNVTTTTPLSERATCPFYFVSTFHARRYPQHITEARCSCSRCLEYNGLSSRTRCEPVYRDVKLLVKTECHNNVWQYSVGIYKMQESCTCAVPRQIRNQQTGNKISNSGEPIPM